MSVIYSDSASAKVNALIKQRQTTAALWNQVAAGDFKKIAEMGRALQYQSDMLLELITAIAATGDRIQVTDGTGKPVAIIGQLDGDKFGIHATDAYFGGTLGDTSTAEVLIENGNAEFSGAITAASFNVWMPLIESDPFVDNDPASGRVSWPSFSLFFAGTEYTIASGNTSSSTHKHIYWVRGASALTTATEMPQDIDNYLIASNISGAHELVLNKPGAGKSITEDALTTSLLKGMQVQPPATATVHIIAGNTGDYELLDVTSGGGVLLAVFFRVITENVTSAPVASLKINVDGTGVQSIKLYNGTNIANSEWDATSGSRGGDMSTIDDYRNMTVLSFPFAESINVTFTLTTQAGAGYLLMRTVYALKTAS